MDERTGLLTEEQALELFAFLLTSARTQIDEPPQYAPLRLMTAAQRFADFTRDAATKQTQGLYESMNETLAHARAHINNHDALVRDLDELCRVLACHLVERSSSPSQSET